MKPRHSNLPGAGRESRRRARWNSALVAALCVGALLFPSAALSPRSQATSAVLGSTVVDVAPTDSRVVAVWRKDGHGSWAACCDVDTGSLHWQKHFPGVALVGHLSISRDPALVYAPAAAGGVYVLDLQDGTLRTRLLTGTRSAEPKVACTQSHTLVADNLADWTASLTSFGGPDLQVAWRRTLSRSYVWEVDARGQTFELLVSEPFGMGAKPGSYDRLAVNAADGHVASRQPVASAPDRGIIPKALPPALRAWLAGLLSREGGVFLARTELLRMGKLWFVGNLEDTTAPGTVFAVRETGQVVWQRHVPDLSAIALHDGKLIAASFAPQEEAMSLIAVRADTGELLWTAQLKCGGHNSTTHPHQMR